jgi:hypothetical protein
MQSKCEFLYNLATHYSSKISMNSTSESNSECLLSFLYQQYQDNFESSKILFELIETYVFNDNETLSQNSSIILISQ